MSDKSISEIKLEYKNICDAYGIMDYMEELYALERFIADYESDTRSGVEKLRVAASKRHDKLSDEVARVRTLADFDAGYSEGCEYICGVDEVGRGPLAGPILTAAVVLPKGIIIPYVNDSKTVSEPMREKLYDIIIEQAISVSFGQCSSAEIDAMGIAVADSEAMRKAVEGLSVRPDRVLVDAFIIPDIDIEQVAMIKGDRKSQSIAAASIVAKVMRDRMMVRYDKEYPGYDFAGNKGYGTKLHIDALRQIGPCEIHRMSFIGNFIKE